MKNKSLNLIDYLHFNTFHSPEKVAIIYDNKIITYKELNNKSNKIANILLANGVKGNEFIPIIFNRNPEMIAAILGILKAGCAFLPISPFTPCLRKKFILEDCRANFLVTNIELVNNFDLNLKIINTNNLHPNSPLHLPSIKSNEVAYVMYTSGSTGTPKGVMIEHGSMMNLFLSLIEEIELNEKEVILALTDYTFDISLIELLMPLVLGGTIILTEQGTIADGHKIKKYLNQYDITIIQATPVTWEIILNYGWKNDGNIKILVGGEKFTTKLAVKLNYSKNNIWNVYGPTETCMWSMVYKLKETLYTEGVPLGKPFKNTTIYILNEMLEDVGVGSEGELFIGGLGLARGYLNDLSKTNEKFILHPITNERIYKTGDIVVLKNNSTICFIGRVDDQLKIGGIRIEAGEIEHVIEQTSFVKKAVVKIHETESYYKNLVAYLEIDEKKAYNEISLEEEKKLTFIFKDIYDEVYLHAEKYECDGINICGWKSSFTGSLFQADELKESFKFIYKNINNSDLTNVLEIGCGAGSILLEFIDKAIRYTAVEISTSSINYIKNQLSIAQSNKVKFINNSYLEIDDHSKYTCIIINSTLQYFPSVNYLMATLNKILSSMKSGQIIIGDVRSMEMFELFVMEKYKNKFIHNSTNISEYFYYKSREHELILSTKFFYSLKKIFPQISHVDICVKHGEYFNELNNFRYDVILYVEKSFIFKTPIEINFNDLPDYQTFLTILENNKEDIIIVNRVPNLFTRNLLKSISDILPAWLLTNFGDKINEEINNKNLIIDLLKFEVYDREKIIQYDSHQTLDHLEIHLYPKNNQYKIRCNNDQDYDDIENYVRSPFNPFLQKILFDKIKRKMSSNLISWVVPTTYIWIDKWPVTINGKIDKKLLQVTKVENVQIFDNTKLQALSEIWENITNNKITKNEKFSDQGLSSLNLHFFLAKISEHFKIDISYNELCKHNTLSKLTSYLDEIMESSANLITNRCRHEI